MKKLNRRKFINLIFKFFYQNVRDINLLTLNILREFRNARKLLYLITPYLNMNAMTSNLQICKMLNLDVTVIHLDTINFFSARS